MALTLHVRTDTFGASTGLRPVVEESALSNETAVFIPGAYWTPERAAEAIARMNAVLNSDAFQQEMQRTAQAYKEGHPPTVQQAPPPPPSIGIGEGAIDRERILYRRGEARDVPEIFALMMLTDLPPLFIEEFIGGFVVAEHDGEFLGCGGLEIYGDAGVIRSVATTPRGRGLGIGRKMAELLVDDARASGSAEVYLFTADAYPFWLHLGFADAPFDDWSEAPRQSWQYSFLSSQREMAAEIGVHPMRIGV